MSREYLTGEREQSRSYSRAVKVTGGTTVYLAGIVADVDAEGNSLAGNFVGQTHRDLPGRGRWFRVRVGHFGNRGDAERYRQQFVAQEKTDAIVTVMR